MHKSNIETIDLGSLKLGNKVTPFAFDLDTADLYEKHFKSDLGQDMEVAADFSNFGYDLLEVERVCWQVLWTLAKTSNSTLAPYKVWKNKNKKVSSFPLMMEVSRRFKEEGVE